MTQAARPDVSIVIVSFNTVRLLRECLQSLEQASTDLSTETFVVDNCSADGSPEMVEKEFPQVTLLRSQVNLGFAAANNVAFEKAQGRYVVLLNSDAFLEPESLKRAVEKMDNHPQVGLAGALLVGRDGSWQPSARSFPSLLNDFLTLTGLSAKFPKSRFFGRVDRTYADHEEPAAVDWVPGAFSIIRQSTLQQVGTFDENFFLYFEEVDLCKRIKAAGFTVNYWPDIKVVHIGGESSKSVSHLSMSSTGSQLTLWRMRSAFLYYRKHHGRLTAWLAMKFEMLWHQLRAWKNSGPSEGERSLKAKDSRETVRLLSQAWSETSGGSVSPKRPW